MINGWWIVSLFVLIHLILQDYGFVGEGFSFGRVPMTKYAFLLFNITWKTFSYGVGDNSLGHDYMYQTCRFRYVRSMVSKKNDEYNRHVGFLSIEKNNLYSCCSTLVYSYVNEGIFFFSRIHANFWNGSTWVSFPKVSDTNCCTVPQKSQTFILYFCSGFYFF